ncbi:MAG: dephospho-CoA kinase [Cyanobacteria bacterium]|nr:dephospho-CoA kinase [Cyanobacteriota bacterium]
MKRKRKTIAICGRQSKRSLSIGITGGIACGKSSVSAILAEKGILVIDTDEISHRLLASPNPTYEAVLARFGSDLATEPGGPINRKRLGQIIFSNADDRRDLEAIMHPAIDALMLQEMDEHKPGQIVAVQVPLLFECKLHEKGYFDEIWAITVEPAIQLERLMKRNNLTQEEAQKRINAQMSQDEKVTLSDRAINNSGTLPQTRAAVLYQLRAAKKKAGLK